jgi:hypothetical protein
MPTWDSEKAKKGTCEWLAWLQGKWVHDGILTNGAVLYYLLRRGRLDEDPIAEGLQQK